MSGQHGDRVTDDEGPAVDASASPIAQALPFGLLAGVVLGVLIDNIGLGIALGLPLGVIFGALLGRGWLEGSAESPSGGDSDEGTPST